MPQSWCWVRRQPDRRDQHRHDGQEQRQAVRRQLEQYCALDTEGMVRIVEALMRVASAAG